MKQENLVGKSLCNFAKILKDEKLRFSLNLLGLTIWGKNEKVELEVKNNPKMTIPSEILNLIKEKSTFEFDVKSEEIDVELKLKENFEAC